jgi:hypothetical protein
MLVEFLLYPKEIFTLDNLILLEVVKSLILTKETYILLISENLILAFLLNGSNLNSFIDEVKA